MAQANISRKPQKGLVVLLVVLTVGGIIGMLIAGFSWIFTLHGGCAMGGLALAFMLVFTVVLLLGTGLVGALTLAGAIVMRRHEQVGDGLILVANLLVIGSFAFAGSPTSSHQVGLDLVILGAAALPVTAVGFTIWRLLVPVQRRRDRALSLVVLIVAMTPVLWLGSIGIHSVAADAFQPVSPILTAGCGSVTSG